MYVSRRLLLLSTMWVAYVTVFLQDKDAIGDIQRTIYYLENVADDKGDPARAEHLKGMAEKLRRTQQRIEEELGSESSLQHKEMWQDAEDFSRMY